MHPNLQSQTSSQQASNLPLCFLTLSTRGDAATSGVVSREVCLTFRMEWGVAGVPPAGVFRWDGSFRVTGGVLSSERMSALQNLLMRLEEKNMDGW